jgi:hypothetical protein
VSSCTAQIMKLLIVQCPLVQHRSWSSSLYSVLLYSTDHQVPHCAVSSCTAQIMKLLIVQCPLVQHRSWSSSLCSVLLYSRLCPNQTLRCAEQTPCPRGTQQTLVGISNPILTIYVSIDFQCLPLNLCPFKSAELTLSLRQTFILDILFVCFATITF